MKMEPLENSCSLSAKTYFKTARLGTFLKHKKNGGFLLYACMHASKRLLFHSFSLLVSFSDFKSMVYLLVFFLHPFSFQF